MSKQIKKNKIKKKIKQYESLFHFVKIMFNDIQIVMFYMQLIKIRFK